MTLNKTRYRPSTATLLRLKGRRYIHPVRYGNATKFRLRYKIMALADAACCLCRSYVTTVEFVDDHTLVSADGDGKTKVWNIATGEEKTEALAGSKFALSKQGNREQQVGRFVCTAEGDLLLIHLLSDVEEGGDKAAKTTRAPVAFFRAPSPIQALDCQGAEIALGCQSGAVLLLRAAVLLT